MGVSSIRRTVAGFWMVVLGLALFAASGRSQSRAASEATRRQGELSVLRGIDYDSSGDTAKIVMDLSKEVSYEAHPLKEDPGRGLPSRIYVDLFDARLHEDAAQPLVIQDGWVSRVRSGQFGPNVVRVVLDMKAPAQPKTYALQRPFRVIVELEGARNGASPSGAKTVVPGRVPGFANPRLKKIVLDPGHGGKDPGAIGVGGVMEKDLVLVLAKKLAHKLRKEMGVEVTLTRDDDSFIPLEDRTAIANAENADLFISLHTNASPNKQTRGLETYYLNNTDDEAAIRLAARENATSRRNISDLQFILSDLIQSSKLEDSVSLAHHLQGAVVSHVGKRYGDVVDLGVKKALFYVLVGARMPSVLVEVFFITNRTEGRNLTRPAYQNTVVDALYAGIKRYRDGALVAKNL